MIKVNKVEVLTDALINSARNHHRVSRYVSKTPGFHAVSQHWQHCPAPSCTAAFNALVACGVYGEEQIKTRDRVQRRIYNKMEKILNDSK